MVETLKGQISEMRPRNNNFSQSRSVWSIFRANVANVAKIVNLRSILKSQLIYEHIFMVGAIGNVASAMVKGSKSLKSDT